MGRAHKHAMKKYLKTEDRARNLTCGNGKW